MTPKQYQLIYDAIVFQGCTATKWGDSRSTNACIRKGWLVENPNPKVATHDLDVTLDGYRAALVYVATEHTAAIECPVEAMVKGAAIIPRPYR
jgi:hypothetical protein